MLVSDVLDRQVAASGGVGVLFFDFAWTADRPTGLASERRGWSGLEGRPAGSETGSVERREHWEKVHRSKAATEVIWFQLVPEGSLDLIEAAGIGPDSRVVDVGIGDAVTPEPEWLDHPSLLVLPGARLRAYRPETMIAEKLHAMVVLGSKNSRMRDFFDVDMLAQRRSFDAQRLAQALRATFERRSTPLPAALPLALTPEFGESHDKIVQWRAFRSKSKLSSAPADLAEVVGRIAAFLSPFLEIAGGKAEERATWQPGGPWVPIQEPQE